MEDNRKINYFNVYINSIAYFNVFSTDFSVCYYHSYVKECLEYHYISFVRKVLRNYIENIVGIANETIIKEKCGVCGSFHVLLGRPLKFSYKLKILGILYNSTGKSVDHTRQQKFTWEKYFFPNFSGCNAPTTLL